MFEHFSEQQHSEHARHNRFLPSLFSIITSSTLSTNIVSCGVTAHGPDQTAITNSCTNVTKGLLVASPLFNWKFRPEKLLHMKTWYHAWYLWSTSSLPTISRNILSSQYTPRRTVYRRLRSGSSRLDHNYVLENVFLFFSLTQDWQWSLKWQGFLQSQPR